MAEKYTHDDTCAVETRYAEETEVKTVGWDTVASLAGLGLANDFRCSVIVW